ncbi:MAG: acyltransferase [Candidatus Hydrogenedentes bacterium]|nr:acyltransferase [Candidatus Hydrogenedentota bacterium]
MDRSSRTEDLPVTGPRFYRPELDWLRFVAFLLVFTVHVMPLEAGDYTAAGVPAGLAHYVLVPFARFGGHGVDLFFVLSAFLITELLLRERDALGTIHVKAFYIRRLLRIWPLYYCYVLLTFSYELAMTDNPFLYYAMTFVFVGNWYAVLWGEIPTITGHLWTISVEEQFYLVWPLLIRWTRPTVLLSSFVGLFLCSTLYRLVVTIDAPDFNVAAHQSTITRMDCFALGGMLAYGLHRWPASFPAAARCGMIAAGVSMFALVAAGRGFLVGIPVTWMYSCAATGSMLLVASAATAPPRTYTSRLLRGIAYLGKISYGLYIWHIIAGRTSQYLLAQVTLTPSVRLVAHMVLSAAVVLALAAISYAVLEKPFLRIKERFAFVKSRPV